MGWKPTNQIWHNTERELLRNLQTTAKIYKNTAQNIFVLRVHEPSTIMHERMRSCTFDNTYNICICPVDLL